MKTKSYIHAATQHRFKAITIKVSHTLSIVDLAVYFTAAHTDEAVKKIKTVSENEFMKAVRAEIKANGEDGAGYLISDMDLESDCDEVEKIINERFV